MLSETGGATDSKTGAGCVYLNNGKTDSVPGTDKGGENSSQGGQRNEGGSGRKFIESFIIL